MIQVTLDTGDLERIGGFVAALTEQNVRFSVSRAMNASAEYAKQQLVQELKRSIDPAPTRWTLGGAFRTYAKARNLETVIGMRSDPQPRGNAAGRYLRPLVYGTRPRFKGADLSAGKLAGRRVTLIPARSAGLVDSLGNVPLRQQTKILAGARSRNGYFIAPVRKGSTTLAIFESKEGFLGRTSTVQRTVRRLFTLEENPKARRPSLELHKTMQQAFAARWPTELQQAFRAELAAKLGTRA